MNKGLKVKILRLRALGWSYNKIQRELKCSKGTIAYHSNPNVKEKVHFRNKIRRRNVTIFKKELKVMQE